MLTDIHGLADKCTPFCQFAVRVASELIRVFSDFDDDVALASYFSLLVSILYDQNGCCVLVQRDTSLVATLRFVHIKIYASFDGRKFPQNAPSPLSSTLKR